MPGDRWDSEICITFPSRSGWRIKHSSWLAAKEGETSCQAGAVLREDRNSLCCARRLTLLFFFCICMSEDTNKFHGSVWVRRPALLFFLLCFWGETTESARYKQTVISVSFYSLVWLLRKLSSDFIPTPPLFLAGGLGKPSICWTKETPLSQCLQSGGFRGDESFADTPSRITGLQLKYLYHTQMMILCHTPCHQPHSNPSITSVPLSSGCVLEGRGSPRPPGPTWLCLPGTRRRSLVPPPSSSRICRDTFFFLFWSCTLTHTHTTHPEASVASVDAPHCALPDSHHRKCSRLVTSPQRQRSHEETTTKQSTYYRKCILCKNASGNVAASVRDLESLFSLCYKLKKNNFKG